MSRSGMACKNILSIKRSSLSRLSLKVAIGSLQDLRLVFHAKTLRGAFLPLGSAFFSNELQVVEHATHRDLKRVYTLRFRSAFFSSVTLKLY